MLIRFIFSLALVVLISGCVKNNFNKDTLTVAVSSTAPPYSFFDENSNKLTGFDIDIANEIAKRLKRKLKVETITFNKIIYSVMSNNVDCGFGSTYVTPEREKIVSFSIPYNMGLTKIAIREDLKDINTLEDLRNTNYLIGVRGGTIYPKILKDVGFKDSQIKVYPEQGDLRIFLENGKIEAIATGYKRLDYLKKYKGLKIKFLEPPIVPPAPCAIVVNINNTETLAYINAAMRSMIKDGTYEKIAVKWFGHNPLKDY